MYKESGGITLPDSLFFHFRPSFFHVDRCNARIINNESKLKQKQIFERKGKNDSKF